MAKKRALILILLLLALSNLLVMTLLVTSLYIFKSNPVKQKGLKGNAQKISLAGLADTTENNHSGLIFNNINPPTPRELVGKIRYLWGPDRSQPIDTSM